MNKKIEKLKMYDIVVHESTRFVFKFSQYEEGNNCSVMDEQENLYTFPVHTIRKGTKEDLEDFNKNSAKKFHYLREYL